MVKKKWVQLKTAGTIFFLLASLLQAEQSQKIYELIYEDIQLLKKQLLVIQERWQNLASEVQSLKNQVQDIQTSFRIWQKEMAETRNNLKDIPVHYQILKDQLDQLSSRLERLTEEIINLKSSLAPSQPLAETKPADLPSAGPPKKTSEEKAAVETQPAKAGGPSPYEIYNNAYSDYLKGNYDLAIEGFKLYREQFSQSPLADNALYWIGECYFSKKNYEEAIAAFNDVILFYPQGDRVPAAYLKKGLCYLEMGQTEEALAIFKLLISKFPLEEEARIAQQKIKEIIER